VFVDRSGRVGIDFGVTGVPETYVVAADGRILDKEASHSRRPTPRPCLARPDLNLALTITPEPR